MKPRIITLGLLVSAYATVHSATAQPVEAPRLGEGPVRTFEEADFNADGMLNKREADTALPALGLHDEDEDGVISRADVKNVLPDIQFADGTDDSEPVRAAEYEQIVLTVRDMLSTNQASR